MIYHDYNTVQIDAVMKNPCFVKLVLQVPVFPAAAGSVRQAKHDNVEFCQWPVHIQSG